MYNQKNNLNLLLHTVMNSWNAQIFDKLKQKLPYLKMLVLFGSRARGDTHSKSDWDFAVLYDEELRQATVKGINQLEIYNILADIFQIPNDKIDVVDLNHCSSIIAHYVARDGKLLYERETGLFERLQQTALMSDVELYEVCKRLRENLEFSLQRRGL